jgi:hypothetical protein
MVCIMDGSDPAPPASAGSVMKNAERALPDTKGSKETGLLLGTPDFAASGAMVLHASGPSGERPDLINAFAVSRCDR